MFNPVNETARNAKDLTTISGSKGGVRVLCEDQEVLSKYNELANLARNGNYWALQIVSGIFGLSSGRLGKDNIFVRQGSGAVYGLGAFFVVLPGATATLEQHSSGVMVLTAITADRNFQELQKKAEKPGFWSVRNVNGAWDPKQIQDTEATTLKPNAFVAISDKEEKVKVAAAVCAEGLEAIHDVVKRQIKGSDGFGMHYTPGKGKIGGLKNCRQAMNACKDSSLNESAILLAQTMHNARNVEGVTWMSDYGGSGVLTQAMRILADNNVQLSKHTVYMNHPTTRPSTVNNLARRLNLEPMEHKKGASPNELVGRLMFLDGPISQIQRLKNDDSYGGKHLLADTTKQSSKIGLFGLGAASAVTGLSLVTVSPAIGASIGIAGGALFVASALNNVAKSVAPKTYNKITGKFK